MWKLLGVVKEAINGDNFRVNVLVAVPIHTSCIPAMGM
jgi:hypothetical protein